MREMIAQCGDEMLSAHAHLTTKRLLSQQTVAHAHEG